MIALPPLPESWRRWVAVGVVAVMALGASCAAGRFSAPVKVEERVEYREIASYRTEWAVRTEYRDRTKVRTRTVIVERKEPSGASTTTTTTDSGTDVVIDSGTTSNGNGSGTTQVVVEKIKVVESGRPGWRLVGQAGWDLGRPVLSPTLYGAQVERRLLGTVWLGAWGRTDKTAGLSLALEW